MSMRSIAAVLAFAVLGCASDLVVREADTREEERRKTAARVGLGLATLGLSEIPLGRARRAEERRQDDARKEEAQAAWKWSLDEARTMGEITKLFGSAPDSCFSSSTQDQICTWDLGRGPTERAVYPIDRVYMREVGWKVGAVCELPKDGSPREMDSCQLSVE
jgi:hypothetical protein